MEVVYFRGKQFLQEATEATEPREWNFFSWGPFLDVVAIDADSVMGGDAPTVVAFATTGFHCGGAGIFGFASGFATGRGDALLRRPPGLGCSQGFEFGDDGGNGVIEGRRRRFRQRWPVVDGESRRDGHGNRRTGAGDRGLAEGVGEADGGEAKSAFLNEPGVDLPEDEPHTFSADEVFGHVVLDERAKGTFAEAEVSHHDIGGDPFVWPAPSGVAILSSHFAADNLIFHAPPS